VKKATLYTSGGGAALPIMEQQVRRAFLMACAVAAAACRDHPLADGVYAFTLTETVRDDCALKDAPGVISTGTLRTTGDVVRLEYAFFDIQLTGTYAHAVERMSLDGSATNVAMSVNGVPCLVDLLTVHLDATTVNEAQFEGFMSFSLETPRPESCVCELWAGYSASRSSP
jgi:hypothetical protein